MPATVRASIKFSLSVREEYRVQWDRFFVETPTFEQVYSGEAHTVRSAPIGSAEALWVSSRRAERPLRSTTPVRLRYG